MLREPLANLDGQTVIDRIGVALERFDARKTRNRTRLSNLVVRKRLRGGGKANHRRRLRPLEIGIHGARQMCSLDPQIADLDGHGGLDLIFEAQVRLLHVRFMIVRLEYKNGRNASSHASGGSAAGSCDGSSALCVGILREIENGIARFKGQRLNVQSVDGKRRANRNRWRAPEEDAIAGTHHESPAEGSPGDADPWTEIGVIIVNSIRENSRGGKACAGVQHRWLSDQVKVISQTEVERDVVAHAPFVLRKCRILLQIRFCRRAGCVWTAEGLCERVGCVRSRKARRATSVQIAAETLQAVENVRAGKIAREKVRDTVNEDVYPGLDRVAAPDKRDGIAKLTAANVGEAGTEKVSADNEIGDSALTDGGLRIDAVRLARLVVPRIPAAGDVHDIGRNCRGERPGQGIRGHIGGAGVLKAILSPAILEPGAHETLDIVSNAHQLA